MTRPWCIAVLRLVILASLLVPAPPNAQELPPEDASTPRLPDGRPLPPTPVRLEGAWAGDDLRVVSWRADLAVDGDLFEGKVSVGEFAHLAPLTVQGTRDGDLVEFAVRVNKSEVSYFAGYIAGTRVVGVLEAPGGRVIDWSGLWVGDSILTEEAE